MDKLTHQEESVMLKIWELQECVIKDIVDKFEEPKPPYTTVASVVRNLEQKGYLNTKKYGNVKVYTPKIKENTYKKVFLKEVVKDYFENSYKELVSFFVKEQKMSDTELDEIIKIIEQGRKKWMVWKLYSYIR